MPGRDGSGPMGEGPMTGGGFGPCGSGQRSSYGRGFNRMGRRGGMGRRNRGWNWFGQDTGAGRADDKSFLETIISNLSRQLEFYKKQRDELDES